MTSRTVMRHACFLRLSRERQSISRQRPKTAMSVRDPCSSTIGMRTMMRSIAIRCGPMARRADHRLSMPNPASAAASIGTATSRCPDRWRTGAPLTGDEAGRSGCSASVFGLTVACGSVTEKIIPIGDPLLTWNRSKDRIVASRRGRLSDRPTGRVLSAGWVVEATVVYRAFVDGQQRLVRETLEEVGSKEHENGVRCAWLGGVRALGGTGCFQE